MWIHNDISLFGMVHYPPYCCAVILLSRLLSNGSKSVIHNKYPIIFDNSNIWLILNFRAILKKVIIFLSETILIIPHPGFFIQRRYIEKKENNVQKLSFYRDFSLGLSSIFSISASKSICINFWISNIYKWCAIELIFPTKRKINLNIFLNMCSSDRKMGLYNQFN